MDATPVLVSAPVVNPLLSCWRSNLKEPVVSDAAGAVSAGQHRVHEYGADDQYNNHDKNNKPAIRVFYRASGFSGVSSVKEGTQGPV